MDVDDETQTHSMGLGYFTYIDPFSTTQMYVNMQVPWSVWPNMLGNTWCINLVIKNIVVEMENPVVMNENKVCHICKRVFSSQYAHLGFYLVDENSDVNSDVNYVE